MEAIDAFHPSRMADRILGMGDIRSLVERAKAQIDEEEAKKLQKKIASNKFDFDDFLSQIQQIKKMGNLKDLASMIPGVGSGTSIQEVNRLLKQFEETRKVMKLMNSGAGRNLARMLGSKMGQR